MAVVAGTSKEKHQEKAPGLKSRAAGSIELPKRRHVGPIRTDAPGVYRQSQILRLFNAQAGVVQLSQAITFRGHQTIAARKIHRTRRPVRAPTLPYNGSKIIPVSTIPHVPPDAPGSSDPVTELDAGIALSVTRIFRCTLYGGSFSGERLRARVEQIVTPLSFESRLRKPCVSIKLSDEWNCAFSRARPAPSTKKYRFAVLYF